MLEKRALVIFSEVFVVDSNSDVVFLEADLEPYSNWNLKAYDNAKLYFEVTFSSTSRS